MNKVQKTALVNLGLAGAGLLLQLLRVLMRDLHVVRVMISVMSLIICCGLVASCLVRRQYARRGGPHYDERDMFICKRALFAGLITLVFVVFLECMMSFLAVGPGGAISIGGLLTILLVGLMSLCFAESTAVLVQYGWGGQADRE